MMAKREIQNSNTTKSKINPNVKIQNLDLGFWIYLVVLVVFGFGSILGVLKTRGMLWVLY